VDVAARSLYFVDFAARSLYFVDFATTSLYSFLISPCVLRTSPYQIRLDTMIPKI
jgi:hypothetical protein